MKRACCIVLAVVFSLLLISCGSTNTSNSSTNQPGPTAASTPPPTGGSGGSSGGSGGSSGGSGAPSGGTPPPPSQTTDNSSAPIIQAVGRNAFPISVGNVTVDATSNNGAGSVTIKTGVTSPTEDTLRFCSYVTGLQNCITVTTFTEQPDGSTAQFTMPVGTWAGAFQIGQLGGTAGETGMSGTQPGLGFRSAMLPASTITATLGTATGAETGSGSMSTSGSMMQINVAGAKPSNSYTLLLCHIDHNCATVGTVTSDSSGTIAATVDIGTFNVFVGIVVLTDTDGFEYVSAFRSQ